MDKETDAFRTISEVADDLNLPQHVLLNLVSLVYYPLRGQGRAVWRAKRDALRALGAVWQQRRTVQQGRRVDLRTLSAALRHGFTVPYVRRFAP